MFREEDFRLFQRVRDSAHYLRRSDLAEGRAYLVSCRHAYLGVWTPKGSFAIRRQKYGRVYMSTEAYWDDEEAGALGTAKPYAVLPHEVPGPGLLGFLERLEAEIPFEEAVRRMAEAEAGIRAAGLPA